MGRFQGKTQLQGLKINKADMVKKENKTVDTSDLLNDDDIDVISNLNSFKRDITAYFDMKLFVNKMKNVINNSSSFEFRSEDAEKFIDERRPNFVIKVSDDKVLNDIISSSTDEDEQINEAIKIISNEIISQMSREITDCIKDETRLNELFKDTPDLKSIVISNMYTIRVGLDSNNISILYFL